MGSDPCLACVWRFGCPLSAQKSDRAEAFHAMGTGTFLESSRAKRFGALWSPSSCQTAPPRPAALADAVLRQITTKRSAVGIRTFCSCERKHHSARVKRVKRTVKRKLPLVIRRAVERRGSRRIRMHVHNPCSG